MPVNNANNKGITRKQIEDILKKFLDLLDSSDGDEACSQEIREEFADNIESYFDELGDDDFFGTEGQSHPFGDKRD